MDLQGSFERFLITMANKQFNAIIDSTIGNPFDSILGSAGSALGQGIGSFFGGGGQIGSSSLGGTAAMSVVNNNNFAGVDSVNQAQLQNALQQNQIQTIQSVQEINFRGTSQ
jgi:hypothetical protein